MRKKKDVTQAFYRIAIVDDEQGIIDALSTVIKRLGYSSKGFTNPLEAVETINNEHFDMLILDYLMEPINADQVIKKIREFNKHIYILLLTGHKDIAPPLETIKSLDIQGYCEKSDKFDQIILLIESGLKSVEQTRIINDLILARKEAEAANHAKSEFLANISHELRTPLNVILSAIQLFSLYINNDAIFNKASANKHLMSMKQNCLRLVRLVNNILDATKIDSGHFELNLQNYDVVSIVRTILDSVDEYIKLKGIKLSFHTDTEEKIISCDINVMERAVLNLLSNAVKFTKLKGNIFVDIRDNEDCIEISIKDDGIGISEEMIDTIFERFIQTDNLLTREHEGSGIGLSITKALIEMHGGRIIVNSKIHKGSEFIIQLPNKLIENISGDEQHGSSILIDRINIELSDIYNIS